MYGVYPVTLTVTVNALGHTCSDTDTTTATITGSLTVNKTVWDGSAWVNNIRVVNGSKVRFKLTIVNNGIVPIGTITITDYLSTPAAKIPVSIQHDTRLRSRQ